MDVFLCHNLKGCLWVVIKKKKKQDIVVVVAECVPQCARNKILAWVLVV